MPNVRATRLSLMIMERAMSSEETLTIGALLDRAKDFLRQKDIDQMVGKRLAAAYKKAEPAPAETKEAAPVCPDSAIEVTVETNADTYPPDRDPSFTFAVENVSKSR